MAKRKSNPKAEPPPKRSVGRPPAVTPEKVERIIHAITIGMDRRSACSLAGVEYHTFNRHVRAHPELRPRLYEADKQLEFWCVKLVNDNARGEVKVKEGYHKPDVKAAQWWLERRRTAIYGRRDPDALTHSQVVSMMMAFASRFIEFVPPEKRAECGEAIADALATKPTIGVEDLNRLKAKREA